MKTRILSALVGVPVLLYFIFAGGLPFAFMVTVLATIGLYEFARMTKGKQQFLYLPMLLCVLVMLIGSYLAVPHWCGLAIMLSFCIVFGVAVFRFPSFDVMDIAVNILGVLYIGWSFAHLIAFDQLGNGTMLVLYLFVGIWSSDSGAYFVGRAIGKHKLCPRVSPKKTIEGSVGGIVLTVLILFAVNCYTQLLSPLVIPMLGIAISVVGQIGDLIESIIKRHYGVKDSGKLIPGHGGILDRFDSIMLAAPVFYYCLTVAQYLGAY